MKRIIFTTAIAVFAAIFGVNAQSSLTERNDLAEANGESYQAYESKALKTQDAVPEVLTKSATIVSSGVLTYNMYLNPNQSVTTAWFEWKYKDAGSYTGTGYAASSTLTVGDVSKTVSGLTPDTVVEFRGRASNSIGETTGNILESPTSPGTLGQDAIAGVFTMEPINVDEKYATFRLAYVSNVHVRLFCEYDTTGTGGFFDTESTYIEQRNAGSGIVEFNVVNLTPGQSYDYRAVLLADDGTLVYADNIVNFTTLGGATGIEDVFGKGKVGIYPNPMTSQSEIYFGTSSGVFTLFDMTGKAVKTVSIEDGRGVLARGYLNPGIYICRFRDQQSGNEIAKKLIVK